MSLSGPQVADLAPDRKPDPSDPRAQKVVHAVVHRDVSAPDEVVLVLIPSFSERHVYECRFWSPRPKQHAVAVGADQFDYPQAGDPALVSFTEDGESWLVSYVPAS